MLAERRAPWVLAPGCQPSLLPFSPQLCPGWTALLQPLGERSSVEHLPPRVLTPSPPDLSGSARATEWREVSLSSFRFTFWN